MPRWILERTRKLKDVKDPSLANFEVDGTNGTGIFDNASILIEALEETGAKCTL